MTTGDKELYISPLNAPKWEKGGIFEGYTPKDEIQSLRTQNSKKFRNPDGSITAQIGGNYHYQDENNLWQDIDFTITQTNAQDFAYSKATVKTEYDKSLSKEKCDKIFSKQNSDKLIFKEDYDKFVAKQKAGFPISRKEYNEALARKKHDK